MRPTYRHLPVLLLLASSLPLRAHNGPPFPIIVDRQVGPCTISVWTHPDVGIGTFFVILGGVVPKNLKIEIGVQPVSGRLPEKRYATRLANLRGQVQYETQVAFDAQELWRVHVLLSSAQGNGETVATVEPTPPGLGRWDLLWYGSPFAAVGFLWFRAMARKRSRLRAKPRGPVTSATAPGSSPGSSQSRPASPGSSRSSPGSS